jgi:uncharacterized protein YndB with AHSA1/START domain
MSSVTTASPAGPSPFVGDRELVFHRVFTAPRELVFDAWTDPDHLARWWGPTGFTLTTSAFSAQPGRTWEFVMHGRDGRDYPNRLTFLTVDRPELLVYEQEGDRVVVHFRVEVSFRDLGSGRTALDMHMTFDTAPMRDVVVAEYGAVEGAQQTLGRLDEHLALLQAGGEAAEELVIERVFDAPRELVFRAWSEPERLAQWWGPKGFALETVRLDFRPGGSFHYSMQPPQGPKMWGLFTYREIVPPERIVFVNAFADEQGAIAANPWLPDWAREVRNELLLEDLGGRTRLTLRGRPLGATDAQRRLFVEMRSSMQAGFKGTFEKLDALLARELGRA